MKRGVMLLGGVLAACSHAAAVQDPSLSAGAATVFDVTRDAFSFSVPTLTKAHRNSFFVGNSFFNQNWVVAPASVETRDGLGPLFNARSCSGCHFKDGRSRPPEPGAPFSTVLLRISVPGRGPHGEPLPDPTYGDQIQGNAIPGIAPEGNVVAEYETVSGGFADGERYTLRRPRYRIEHPGFGPTAPGLLVSPRVAPAMIGVGLLESVPEAKLRALADPDDADHDGISGRPNVVWGVAARAPALGRFGWKAEQPSVRQQVASAFVGDMGITSTLFPSENHTLVETSCAEHPSGGAPEATELVFDSVVLYARSLAVPARRGASDPRVLRGERLFHEARCSACHAPTLVTADPGDLHELGGQTIHPYTDLLLHDMGEELADDRPTFEATGREWRTAPLWGIGLVSTVNGHTLFLHDGRARNLAEAVLFHGGEAALSRDTFSSLSASDRGALLAFVDSL